jgi:hypothetical protein
MLILNNVKIYVFITSLSSTKTFTLGTIDKATKYVGGFSLQYDIRYDFGDGVSPLMMKAIKNIRQRLRVNKILREISEIQKAS